MKRHNTYVSASSSLDLLSLAQNLEDVAVEIEVGEYGQLISSAELDTLYDAITILHSMSEHMGVYDSVAATCT